MTTFLTSLTLIVSLFFQGIILPLAQTPPTQAELEAAARAFINQLASGDYQAATASFDDTMRSGLPPERLKGIWTEMAQQYGALQNIGEAQIAETGEYTAVNITTNFERAQVNLRVVYNQQGQISGFFQYPLDLIGKPSGGLLVGLALAALLLLLGPLALGWLARRKLGVPWRVFFIGAGIFILFQIFLRIPLVNLVQASLGTRLQASTGIMLAWIAVLSLTAGLVEEIGRYIGYRWLLTNDAKTWKLGVMYGLGHGGIEAILLAGFSALSSLVLMVFWPQIAGMLPAVQRAPIAMQLAPLLDASAWTLPLASIWERMCAMTLHVALSLLVLQVFRRGKVGWLWAAVGAHTLANLVVIGLPLVLGISGQASILLSSGLLLLVGVAAAAVIYRLRE
jgi:uncharacterized membrane protein YhfC